MDDDQDVGSRLEGQPFIGKSQKILNTHHGGTRTPAGVDAQYNKVGLIEAKEWMERRLQGVKGGVPAAAITKVTEEWTEDLTNYDFDSRIVETEAV